MTFDEYVSTEEWKQMSETLRRRQKRTSIMVGVLSALVLVCAFVAEILDAVLDLDETDSDMVVIVVAICAVAVMVIWLALTVIVSVLTNKLNAELYGGMTKGWQLLLQDVDLDFYDNGMIDIVVEYDGLRDRRGIITKLSTAKFIAPGGEKLVFCEKLGEIAGQFMNGFCEYLMFCKIKHAGDRGYALATARVTVRDGMPKRRNAKNQGLYVKNGKMTFIGKTEYKRLKKMGVEI